MTIERKELEELLMNSLQVSRIKETETLLKERETRVGFIPSLLEIILSCGENALLGQTSAVYLKNKSRNWESFSAQDKDFVKKYIVQAISTCSFTIRPILLACVGTILSFEIDNNSWPELPSIIQSLLSSQDSNLLYTGLTVLLELVKTQQ
jgi:hypothetical protein